MDIIELRDKIDAIDDEIIRLFCGRMRVSADIAQYKAQRGLPVFDPERERSKLDDVLSKTDSDLRVYMGSLYERIFELSREHQKALIGMNGSTAQNVECKM